MKVLSIRIKNSLFSKIPTILTISRLFISPLFFLFYSKYKALGIPFTATVFVLLFLLAISEISDFLDGYLARRYNWVSDLGKLLDPMADTITHISVLLVLTQPPVNIPLYWVLLFLYRDLMISTLRTLCALKGVTLAARLSGKIKAFMQGVVVFAVVLCMVPYAFGAMSLSALQTISSILVACTSLYALGSGIEYLYANRGCIKLFWHDGTR